MLNYIEILNIVINKILEAKSQKKLFMSGGVKLLE